jgi:hypothetical protein
LPAGGRVYSTRCFRRTAPKDNTPCAGFLLICPHDARGRIVEPARCQDRKDRLGVLSRSQTRWRHGSRTLGATPLDTATWQNDTGKPISGGCTWTSTTLDTKTGALYVPGGNSAPDFNADVRSGGIVHGFRGRSRRKDLRCATFLCDRHSVLDLALIARQATPAEELDSQVGGGRGVDPAPSSDPTKARER